MLRAIVIAAVVGGAIAGLFVTVAQAVRAVPLILEAERYEVAGAPADAQHGHGTAGAGHSHEAGSEEHAGGAAAWVPGSPVERAIATTVANLLTAIGFALLLGAAFALDGGADWHRGLRWGLGGYAVFYLAPALGLPPELPGMAAAGLEARQLWWVGAVGATAIGLYLLLRVRHWYGAVAGAMVLALPHAIGAPQPAIAGGLVPDDLIRDFATTSLITNFLFWIVLGAATGLLFGRLAPPTADA